MSTDQLQGTPMRLRHLTPLVVLVVAAQCGPTGTPMLSVSGPTSAFRDGTAITLRLVASDAEGKVGRGTVSVTPDVGVVSATSVMLDEFGTAAFTFSCNAAMDQDCLVDAAVIKLRWTSVSPPVALDYSVRLGNRPAVSDGGAGGGLPSGCPAATYSRSQCQGNQVPGVNVACCHPSNLIPACTDQYVCNGMKVTLDYREFARGDAGALVPLELEFVVPADAIASEAECMMGRVGFVARRAGADVGLSAEYTYGTVTEGSGSYFGIRSNAVLPALRAHEQAECQPTSATDGGGVTGIWHSSDGRLFRVSGASVSVVYEPATPTRFFWISLRKR